MLRVTRSAAGRAGAGVAAPRALGLRVGAAHPVWPLLLGQGIGPGQLGEDLLAGVTAT
ncbi:hypothetical protein [Frankia sp. KB5]|uniref:hypothetical protein n=1 Tax=Frankia sp. KB5 TaxID=683318 RepID=UPI0012FF7ECD|nr:hypothetical protein [Frankia sp. KB5]